MFNNTNKYTPDKHNNNNTKNNDKEAKKGFLFKIQH